MIITEGYAEGMRRRDEVSFTEHIKAYSTNIHNTKRSRKRFLTNVTNMIKSICGDRLIYTIHEKKYHDFIFLSYLETEQVEYLAPCVFQTNTKTFNTDMTHINLFMTIHTMNRIIQTEKIDYQFIGQLLIPLLIEFRNLKTYQSGDVKIFTKMGVLYTNIKRTSIIIHTFIRADKLMDWKKTKHENINWDNEYKIVI